MMGSGAEVAHETVDALIAAGEKVGLLKVRLFRPFAIEAFVAAIPASVKSIAVLDRTKEPGATGEPLYCDVITALRRNGRRQEGDRRTLRLWPPRNSPRPWSRASTTSSRKARPKNHFTIGINDDVTHTSLDYDPEYSTEAPGTVRALFYGLGADGTVGANKNSIKIIGEETDNFAQGYFVYDSKKVRLHHHFPPALRAQADPLQLPDHQGQFRGLPPVLLPGTHRHAEGRRTRRHLPAQQPLRPRTKSGTNCRAWCSSRSSTRS